MPILPPRFRRAAFAAAATFLSAVTLASSAGAAAVLKGTTAASGVTQAQLREYLTYIASDELQGRDTPSPGLDKAAQYIADHLKSWGAKPMGDKGTYFQKIALVRESFDRGKCRAWVAGKDLKAGDDFLPAAGRGSVSGPLVYVGHGWVVKSKGIDAYKGLDVKGKIVVVSGAWLPEGLRFSDLRRDERGKDWFNPAAYAAANGAAGIIRLPVGTDDAGWARMKDEAPEVEPYVEKFGRRGGGGGPQVPTVTLSPAQADALFAGEKTTAKAAMDDGAKTVEPWAFADGKKAQFTLAVKEERLTTQNVVAVVEGNDPKLRGEYVALGAHYDHVGVSSRTDIPDRINNGADDDGSGTVSLLAIAEALSKNPAERPARSVLFVWHCGEEHGLWGSEYFTSYPTVPLDRIVTQLNIDMIGRSKAADNTDRRDANLSGPNEVYVIGSKMLSSKLGEVVESVNRDYAGLTLNYRYDDPNDPNRFYYRSDHYNYAKHDIPITFWFDGVHQDYHRPSDEVSKIDFAKMEKVARTVLLTAVAVGDLPERPAVDKKQDKPDAAPAK
jgi:Zn-dependent M28 family amino/carboxypeptidase